MAQTVPVFWWLATSVFFLVVSWLIVYLANVSRLKTRAKKLYKGHIAWLPELPIIGNIHIFWNMKSMEDIWGYMATLAKKYPQGITFWIGHIAWLVMPDLEVIEAIMSSSEAVEKNYIYQVFNHFSCGVFNAKAEVWKKLRKRLNWTFNQKSMDIYLQVMNDQINICMNLLSQKENVYFNIQPYMTRVFFDITSGTHFGTATNEQIYDKYDLPEKSIVAIKMLTDTRVLMPLFNYDFLFRFSSTYWKVRRLQSHSYKILYKIISERLEKVNKVSEDKEILLNYVDIVIQALKELNIESDPINCAKYIADLYIAGSHTTSVATSALFYYLALNPDCQKRVYEEVSSIYGNEKKRTITKQDLSKMSYLEMCIKECLRHCGPPGIIRLITQDTDVGKYIIPKGTNVYLRMSELNKNPLYWEKPTEFYPEHFLPEKVLNRPKMAYFPFSTGPRDCPGKVYAMHAMKCLASNVIINYQIATNLPLDQVKYQSVLMTEQINGYPIKLTPRN